MAALKKAFQGSNLPALVLKIMKVAHEPIPTRYTDDLTGLIRWMIKLDPEKRPDMNSIVATPALQSSLCEAQIAVGRVDSMFD
jgi:hypothetical protein